MLPAQFTDTLVAGVGQPTALAFLPDGRMLVTTQPGRLRVVSGGTLLPTPALDLSGRICSNSERGLLGVAADPDAASKAFYVYYTARGTSSSCPTGSANPAGAPTNRVSRFVIRDDNTVDPASETILLDGIYSNAGNHNAGDLHVGKDGHLYVSTGDGGCDYKGDSGCAGSNDAARDLNILNGKILRITRSGGIPADNPFVGAGTASCKTAPTSVGTTCREIFATGLRNPFRIAFDPNASGTSFRINDVGQNVWEEIDQGVKGADYGWNVREGHCANTGSESNCGGATPAQFTDPVHDYGHSTGCASITGGAYVPNGIWPSAYTGAYLFSDYVCGKIFALSPGGVRTDFVTGLGGSSAVHLAFGPYAGSQALYYTSYAEWRRDPPHRLHRDGQPATDGRTVGQPHVGPGPADHHPQRLGQQRPRRQPAHLPVELRRRKCRRDDVDGHDPAHLSRGQLDRQPARAGQRWRNIGSGHRHDQLGQHRADRHHHLTQPDGVVHGRCVLHLARYCDGPAGRHAARLVPQLDRHSPARHAHPPVPRAAGREQHPDHRTQP